LQAVQLYSWVLESGPPQSMQKQNSFKLL